jgi:glyoxylase-like metal-dependent hydrolase (beta-lactamase superfamily II)
MAAPIPFVPPLEPVTYGRAEQVSPLIRRVIAENPSKYSYRGTGTYVIGRGEVAVIDPGPALDSHRDALAAALAGERVVAILVTHCHADHSPLAAWLQEQTGAPTYAAGPHGTLDDPDEEPRPEGHGLARASDGDSDAEGEEADSKEAVDTDFAPTHRVVDGTTIAGDGWTIEAVTTPGHTSNHTCFALHEERALFTGDHVMGWSTTVVSPPDGDMRAYCDSLRKVMARTDATLWPTHGNPVTDPAPFLAAYLDHRLDREGQVLACVRAGTGDITDIVKLLYADVRVELHKAAARSVLAHLRKLVADGAVLVADDRRPSSWARYVPAT